MGIVRFSVYRQVSAPGGGGLLYIFWVRGRAIGKGIDFHDFGIRNGIDFRNFRNWYRVGYAISGKWYKVRIIYFR